MKRPFNSNLTITKALILSVLLLSLLAACGPNEETDNTPAPPQNNNSAYPVPGDITGYPTTVTRPTTDPYAPPSTPDIDEAERFNIDRPVSASDTTITGNAPRGISVAIIDVTFGGVILGTGVVDNDGRFSVPVTEMTEGHRIGLTVTDIQDGRTFEEIAVELYDYRGEGFMNVPSVGVFFDSVVAQP